LWSPPGELICESRCGAPGCTTPIANNTRGYAALLAWIAEHTPGPRLAVSIEGTRSYGLGVTRAVTAAGLAVIEAEQPTRTSRRGRGKSDPIDAHLAVKFALGLDVDRLPTPRADGDRDALRILLGARHDLTLTATAQTNRLRALLRDGEDPDHALACASLTDTVLATLARRRLPAHATRAHAVRHDEIRRLALAVRQARHALTANRAQLHTIVDELAPGLTARHGIGPVTAAQVIVSFSHPGRVRSEAAFAALAGASPLQASSGQTLRHRLNRGGNRALKGPAHHRPDPHGQLPPHPRLRRPPPRRREEPARDPPLPQALPRPRALPHPHHHNDQHLGRR
jgi:transposase